MPDTLDATGLTTKTLTELRAELVAALQAIYGVDINVDQDSPDGQQVNIYAQGGVDLREVLEQINAGFDPDQAEGRVLDQRVAINGIARTAGTFTFQDIEVTTDRALNLVGLDLDAAELNPTGIYTIKDAEGNLFYLLSSQTIAGAGTYTYTFRAAALGKVEVTPNTINLFETVIPGVTAVNNPSAANSIGVEEESDFDLRVRRRASVALPALGYLDSIQAEIANLDNVSEVIVLENDTGSVDGNGTPGHTIWAIVEGGDPDEIAEVLYKKKTAGAGMRGAQVVDITRVDGGNFQAKYDLPVSQDLYIRFTLTFSGSVDLAALKQSIVDGVSWGIGADGRGDTVTAFILGINPNYVITGMEVSDDGAAWAEVVSPTSPLYRFVNDTTRITIT